MSVVFTSNVRTRFDWNPELEALQAHLLGVERYLAHSEIFVEATRQEAQVDIARRFEEEVDPSGTPWPPLVQPAPEQVGILRLTTEMSERAIHDAFVVSPVGLFFNTSALPPYWIHHDLPSNRLPQRQFIGLSEVARERIERVFDEWVAGGLVLAGRFQRQYRAPAGTFAAFPK